MAAAEAMAAAETKAAAEAQALAEAEAAKAAGAGYTPGRNLDDEIAAYEASRGAADGAEHGEPAAAAETMPTVHEPAPAEPAPVEREPAIAATEIPAPAAPATPVPPEELPVAAAATAPTVGIEPIPTAVGQPVPASIVDGALAWPEPAAAAAPFEPAWPDADTSRRRAGANLPAIEQPAQPLAAHSCPSCGLSLSASARFCRRCGTPQQVNAAR
jgi:hypothetical protein